MIFLDISLGLPYVIFWSGDGALQSSSFFERNYNFSGFVLSKQTHAKEQKWLRRVLDFRRKVVKNV